VNRLDAAQIVKSGIEAILGRGGVGGQSGHQLFVFCSYCAQLAQAFYGLEALLIKLCLSGLDQGG